MKRQKEPSQRATANNGGLSAFKRFNITCKAEVAKVLKEAGSSGINGNNNWQLSGNNNNVTIHKHYHIDTAPVLQLEALTEKYMELFELTAPLLDQKQREHLRL